MTDLLLAMAVPLAFGLYAIFASGSKKRREESFEQQRAFIREEALKYKAPLARKRNQLITLDDYGDVTDMPWRKEVQKFFNEKIGSIPREITTMNSVKATLANDEGLSNVDMKRYFISGEEVFEIIDQVAREGEEASKPKGYTESLTGIEYERYCADLLIAEDWSATVLPASNDQGVDILARKGEITWAIQCKKYSKPVGNKAVQEVVSGARHYAADFAAVVSNNSFTPAAKQLASSNNVRLLHHSELGSL